MAKKKHDEDPEQPEQSEQPETATEAAEAEPPYPGEGIPEDEPDTTPQGGIPVRATKVGEYPTGCLRQPGEAFFIKDEADFSDVWMVRA